MNENSAMNSEVYVELDIGNLTITRAVYLKDSLESAFSEEVLKEIATFGTQQLINEIFKLPSKYHEHVPIAKLPEPLTIIPRGKPLPQPKKPTKWETFAKQKGIQKKKKEKLVWDEKTKEWKPLFGYRGINKKDDWLVEIPQNGDPNIDYFAKEKEVKKEKIAKNEFQRLKNIARGNKMKVAKLEFFDKANREQLSTTRSVATASVSHFMDKEKMPKNNMKKRKFTSNIPSSMKSEKENNLKILEELNKKKPKLDIKEAVELHMAKSQKIKKSENSMKKKSKSKKNKFNKFSQSGKKSFKKSKKPAFKT